MQTAPVSMIPALRGASRNVPLKSNRPDTGAL